MRTVLSFQPRSPKIEMGWKFLLATIFAFGLAATGEPITLAREPLIRRSPSASRCVRKIVTMP